MAQQLLPTQKKMNWHITLIYFILWLMAFMNLINGLVSVFGIQAAPTADGGIGFALHVYPSMTYPQIFILDGVFALVMCMYTVYVRFQLAGMKRRAPVLLMVLFALNIVESLAYILLLTTLVPDMVAASKANGNDVVLTGAMNAVVSAVVAGLTWVYYQRRRDLFTN